MTRKRIVGFSGGIDSQACAAYVLDKYPPSEVILLNSQAGGNEHPMTVEFIRWYSANVHPVIEVVPLVKDMLGLGTMPGQARDRRSEMGDEEVLTFDKLAWIKGRFPSRKAQFCTFHLKLVPQLRWINENLVANGIDFDRYIGVRADESANRAALPTCEWDEFFDCILHRPLLHWSKERCFDLIRLRGEEVNPLYLHGFGRVGCAPCVNSSKGDVRLWAARFPEMIEKVRLWEQSVGRTFFPPCVPGLTINWVDDVVAWSKTEWGGRKLALPTIEEAAESGSCASKYGLCE